MTTTSLDAKARRAAARAGYIARKSAWRRNSVDNHGGFQVLDGNMIVSGERFDMTAEEVIEFCSEPEVNPSPPAAG